jgi:NAD(P)-dependent dehydrogenase (short-subunit alcohol dehydrogenase family)
MVDRGDGTIINLASVAGLRGGRAGIAYTASKWALVGLTQNIASTLGPEGIRAFAICPSNITGAVSLTDGGVSEVGRERVRRDSKKPPPGNPDDVAGLVSFLLTAQARHLNGIAIPLDGGLLAH